MLKTMIPPFKVQKSKNRLAQSSYTKEVTDPTANLVSSHNKYTLCKKFGFTKLPTATYDAWTFTRVNIVL